MKFQWFLTQEIASRDHIDPVKKYQKETSSLMVP